MNLGKLVFSQLMGHLPLTTFRRCVARYRGHFKVKSFSCLEHYLCMAFAQLTFRESLRDIEACLRAQSAKLYHMGIRSAVSRSTLADANESRDWRIYCDFAQSLIGIARRLYAEDSFGVELKNTVYALDSTTIDLCLSMFPWAPFRSTKAAVKLHTLLDLRGNIPSFIFISDGKLHDVNILDELLPEAGAFYVMDRGYIDFERLARLHQAGSFFVTRAKSNFQASRRYSATVDRTTGLVCDQTVVLTGFYSRRGIRGAAAKDQVQRSGVGQTAGVPDQQLRVARLTIAQLYRLSLASGAVLQMDQAASSDQGVLRHQRERRQDPSVDRHHVYVLVAIVKKRLDISASLYEILQILSLTMFERTPLDQLLTLSAPEPETLNSANQLSLFV